MLVSEQAAQVAETTSETEAIEGDQAELYVAPTGVHPTPSGGLSYVPTIEQQISQAQAREGVGQERGIIPPDVETELPLALAHQRISTLTKQRNALAESGDTLIVYLQRAMRNLPRGERELIEQDMRGEARLAELGIIDIVFPPTKRRESR